MTLENDGRTAIETDSTLESKETPVEPPKQEVDVPSEPSKYEPNFKFKVMDEEKEFDEFLRGVVKGKEEEEKLRDLYTKAHGLEANKKTLETYKEKVEKHYAPIENQYNQVMANLGYLDTMVQKKDYQSFFDTLKISKQDILKYALDLVKYEELPPEQKAQIDHQREVERNNAMLLSQQQSTQSQVQEYAVQVRTLQLNNELMKPEVTSFVQSFDTKAGKPGAFREQVIRHANLAYYQNQMDLPVEQAVKEVMALYGNLVAPQMQPPQQTPTPQAQQRPPVIPNVQSSGNSPAKMM